MQGRDSPHSLPLSRGAPCHLWDHRSERYSTCPAGQEPRGPGRASSYLKKGAPFLPHSFLTLGGVPGGSRHRPHLKSSAAKGPGSEVHSQGHQDPRLSHPPAPPAHLPVPPGQLAAAAPFSSRPESAWRAQVPAAPRALGRRDTHRPGRRPGPENRWPRRGSRDSRLLLTQKMKLNPKSRYLMHLLPPLTGMVQAGLAWDKRHARLGQKGLDNRLRLAAARGWPEAPLLKSATPYGARPAALRMCRGMPTPPPGPPAPPML